jgi:hypothetical protein
VTPLCARRFILLMAGAITAALLLPASAGASHPLRTAVVDAGPFNDPARMAAAFDNVRAAGAGAIRIYASWRRAAPAIRPANFDPANPADPAYDWSLLDQQVRLANARHLAPILSIQGVPDWAEGPDEGLPGTVRPDPTEFGLFARAAARRYSGSFEGLPRVRYWQVWNEPNHFHHLGPQYDTPLSKRPGRSSRLVSPAIYRALVNSFADAVHDVRGDNLVVAGALAPFGHELAGTHIAHPMVFMRRLLCMTRWNRPQPGCRERIRFDVWSHHPYTSGGPTHEALASADVSLGDLPEMRRLLRAAVSAKKVVSRRRVAFWATEFSWDTDPPDPNAVPLRLHRRWVAEALYRMWRNGISLVTWFTIQDSNRPVASGLFFQSGLYFGCADGLVCERPKPSLRAFRFPFVAFTSGDRVLVWGRTPWGRRGRLVIEHRGARWRKVVTLRSDRHGIFTDRVRAPRRGFMRARLLPRSGQAPELSVPFSLRRVPDRAVNPFG